MTSTGGLVVGLGWIWSRSNGSGSRCNGGRSWPSDCSRTTSGYPSFHDPVPHLAARFGAKEAVMKALGVGLWKFAFRDVEVVRRRAASAVVALHGKAAALAAERGVTGLAAVAHAHRRHGDGGGVAMTVERSTRS